MTAVGQVGKHSLCKQSNKGGLHLATPSLISPCPTSAVEHVRNKKPARVRAVFDALGELDSGINTSTQKSRLLYCYHTNSDLIFLPFSVLAQRILEDPSL